MQLRNLQEELLPGYQTAILSIIKEGPLRGLAPAFEWIGKREQPFSVLIVHVRHFPNTWPCC